MQMSAPIERVEVETETITTPEVEETPETIWSHVPDVSEALIQKALQVPFRVFEDVQYPRDVFHLILLRKRTLSLENREKLYNDLSAKAQLLKSRDHLISMSKATDVAITDLAFVLCGMNYLKNFESMNPEDCDSNEVLHRRKMHLARQASNHRSKDLISGHIVQIKTEKSVTTESTPTKNISTLSRGEKNLLRCMEFLGIPSDHYTTESQQKNNPEPGDKTPTPVIVFHQPLTIFGRKVHWIDTRHFLIIHEIVPVEDINALKERVSLCTEKYGPGAILWMKYGFAQRIVDEIPDVLHLRSLPNKVNHQNPAMTVE